MLLCDVGNTSLHFFDGDKCYKEDVESFDISTCKNQVFYVNVNPNLHANLEKASNWIDLKKYVDFKKYYETMGIDRIMVCEAVDNGIIIDAGSAITVDVMQNAQHLGGFIYPGIEKMHECYANISSRLNYSFNFELDLDKMPKNSKDAISYGFLRLLYGEVTRHNKPIYLTGGNASLLQALFKDAYLDNKLIFKGMKTMISRMNLC